MELQTKLLLRITTNKILTISLLNLIY